MLGGYDCETVTRIDEKTALLRIESAKDHRDKPCIKEYKVDSLILSELEAVVRKYRMNFWHHKKFTNMFICDGENHSFSFDFGDANINFTSQFYPAFYSEKLNELKNITKKYIEV